MVSETDLRKRDHKPRDEVKKVRVEGAVEVSPKEASGTNIILDVTMGRPKEK